jgi:hypothetical protein
VSAPVENLVERLHAKRSGKGWIAKCPVHEDHKPSLSLDEGADGRALLKCHAGFFERSQSCRNLFYSITVSVDSHRAGGGRNRPHPVTRHRNTGGCSERVADFLRGLHDPLWLCREHYVFAGISSKCRCAKCEREHDARAPNRRTAQAAKPVFHPHAVIVIPFRILGKLNLEAIRDKETILSALRINPLKKNIPGQPEVVFRTGGIDYQFGCIDTLKRELHGTTKNPSNCSPKTYPS